MLVVRMSPSSLPQHKNNRPRSPNKTLFLLQPGAKQKEQSWNIHNRKEKKLLSSPWMKSCCCKPARAFLLSLLFPKDSTGKGRGKNPTTPTHRTETEKQTYPPGMQFISRSPSPLQPASGKKQRQGRSRPALARGYSPSSRIVRNGDAPARRQCSPPAGTPRQPQVSGRCWDGLPRPLRPHLSLPAALLTHPWD